MKMKRYATFDTYLEGQTRTNQSIIRALRKLVKRTAPKLEESVKWGNGCWVKGTAPVSYVYSDRNYVQFGFFAGASLKDPQGTPSGARPVRAAHQGVQAVRHRREGLRGPPAPSGAVGFVLALDHQETLTIFRHVEIGRPSGLLLCGRPVYFYRLGQA